MQLTAVSVTQWARYLKFFGNSWQKNEEHNAHTSKLLFSWKMSRFWCLKTHLSGGRFLSVETWKHKHNFLPLEDQEKATSDFTSSISNDANDMSTDTEQCQSANFLFILG